VDLVSAAHTMQNAQALLAEKVPDTRSEQVKSAQLLADGHVEAARIRARGEWSVDGDMPDGKKGVIAERVA
jgi:hypothetical protein